MAEIKRRYFERELVVDGELLELDERDYGARFSYDGGRVLVDLAVGFVLETAGTQLQYHITDRDVVIFSATGPAHDRQHEGHEMVVHVEAGIALYRLTEYRA